MSKARLVVTAVIVEKRPVREVARSYGVARSWVYTLVGRYRADHDDWPRSVGLSAWGTSAMRTSGDDIAEILALLGVRPTWDGAAFLVEWQGRREERTQRK